MSRGGALEPPSATRPARDLMLPMRLPPRSLKSFARDYPAAQARLAYLG